MIKANNLHKSYGDLHVLKGIDIKVGKGEIISIVGKSGAGKSTLLHILGTLDKADKGELFIDQICSDMNLPMGQVSSTLLEMEFNGLISALPGKMYRIK